MAINYTLLIIIIFLIQLVWRVPIQGNSDVENREQSQLETTIDFIVIYFLLL